MPARPRRHIPTPTRGPSLLLSAAIPLAVGAAFWVPAIGAAHGFFPAPLDDVYIHYDFARSLAEGHPFEWIPGQGYSSGETSPLYALLLAIGWLVGFRGRAIAIWAAILAIASVALLLRSVVRLARPCPRWLAWMLASLPLAVGLVDWSLFSGMEVAVLTGALGASLVALERAREAPRGGPTRERRQWTLGLWGAALVLLRPECGVMVAVFAVLAARGAGARSGLLALARAALPGAIATALVLGLNQIVTGDPRSAGAQLKLLSSNPYLSEVDRARTFVENTVVFAMRGLRGELSAWRPGAILVPALAAVAIASRRSRTIATACVASAIGWTLLVSWNGNSPFHNFRYYVPGLVLLLVAASLGLAAIARRSRGAGVVLGLATIGLAAARLPAQIDHFRRCAANIRDQQIEAGTRLASLTPPGARILLGDAGAIPFVSGRAAIDALGLGGYRRMPFARAAVFGEAATLELLERLPPSERPTHLALYPNWFSAITGSFGVEIDRVTIQDNVICGGPTKGIYRADWSALAPGREERPGQLDELDVADVVSEAEHAYVSPAPLGGWTLFAIKDDLTLPGVSRARRFDGGRIVPEHQRESFVPRVSGNVRLVLRADDGAGSVLVETGGAATEIRWLRAPPGAWREGVADLVVRAGEPITLYARVGAYQDHHVWLVDSREMRDE